MSKDNQENKIVDNSEAESIRKDEVPSANDSNRDSSNSKKIKMAFLIILAVLIMLIGIGLSIGRYSKSQEEQKSEENEKVAQSQKSLSETASISLADDQNRIANSSLKDLPTPSSMEVASASDPAVSTPPQVVGKNMEPPVPSSPPVQKPHYKQYKNSDDSTPIVTPRIQAEQSPVPVQTQLIKENDNEESDDVLIDIYGAKKADLLKENESGLANGSTSKHTSSMLLSKGTTIPCVLNSRIDSTYKGFTTCQVSKDVYSANGKVLLVERGSKVFGEQNITINQGQARIAVLWSRIETPNGTSVDIDSPAAGQLGETGINAKVNSHFWKRFGGAVMLSLIKDVSGNLSTRLAQKETSGGTTNVNNTTSTADTMSEKILENTINIPPTATENHGSLINILIVRDIDFGGIYSVE